ncbi:MAG: carbohydrate ABC transporter permease [Spirochaetota bacterium]
MRKSRIGVDLLFVGPIFVVYTLLFMYPFFEGLYYSFTNWNGVDPQVNFIGLKNYIEMFTKDEYFLPALQRTFFIAVLNVTFVNILAMVFALSLTNDGRLNNLWRAMIFMPYMISMVVCGFIWRFMLTNIAENLSEVTELAFINQSWLGDPNIVVYSIVIVSTWWIAGYIMTIYIAGILSIDQSLIEAGEIDGCNTWQSFYKIKLPLMMPVVTVGVFLSISYSLKIFDTIYSLTGGGPGKASEVMMLNLYRDAFVYNRYGYGTAKAIVLTIIIILITFIQMRITNAKGNVES